MACGCGSVKPHRRGSSMPPAAPRDRPWAPAFAGVDEGEVFATARTRNNYFKSIPAKAGTHSSAAQNFPSKSPCAAAPAPAKTLALPLSIRLAPQEGRDVEEILFADRTGP